jgi:PGF-CTERM protein
VQTATSTPAKQSKKTPGFEIIFGVTALLGVTYLYRRKKTK